MPLSTPFRDLLDCHVTAADPDTLEAEVEAGLAILTDRQATAAEKTRARDCLERVSGWFDGNPKQVIALIRALAALDPLRRERRKAALCSAWARRLTTSIA